MVTFEKILFPSGVGIDKVEVASREEIETQIGKLTIGEEFRLRGPRAELIALGCDDCGEPNAKCLDYVYDDVVYGAYPTD